MTTAVPLTNAQQLSDKIAELQAALQVAAPSYESLLHQIHVALQKDDELVHLLKEEEVGVICAGLAKKKNIVIATSASKSTTSSGKKLKDIGMSDLGM